MEIQFVVEFTVRYVQCTFADCYDEPCGFSSFQYLKKRKLILTNELSFILAGVVGYSASATFRPLRAVSEMFRCTRDFTVPKSYRAFRAATTNPMGSHPSFFYINKNSRPKGLLFLLAGVVGFEPTQTVLETGVLPLTPYPYM